MKFEKAKQRKQILSKPEEYLQRIEKIKDSIKSNGNNSTITENSLKGIEELENDFVDEIENQKEKE